MRHVLPALAAPLLFAAPAIVQGQAPAWSISPDSASCTATRRAEHELVVVKISPEPDASGIGVYADALSDIGGDRPSYDFTLRADDNPPIGVSAAASTQDGRRGLWFAFRPTALMLAYPEGFTLSVYRGETRIYETDLRGAEGIFDFLANCSVSANP